MQRKKTAVRARSTPGKSAKGAIGRVAKPVIRRSPGGTSAGLQTRGALQSFEGGCYCGAIEYTYQTTQPPSRWEVRLCQCGFCRGHGVRATTDLSGEVQFRFERPEFLRRYRFALRTTDFLLCKECGIYVAAVLLSGRGAQASINLNTLRAEPPGLRRGVPVKRDAESGEERRARRINTWTPVRGPV